MIRTDGQPSDRDQMDEQLVAYLDHELDERARGQVERKLADDPDWRNRLRDLQRTWDQLDHLPSVATDRAFTETTVEMVAAQAAVDVKVQQKSRLGDRFDRTTVRRVVGLCAALAVGYGLIGLPLLISRNRQLRDLPVVENVDLYRHAESVEFLRGLEREGLFVDDEMDGESPNQPDRLFTEFDQSSIRHRVDTLTPMEKRQLQRKQERFDKLDPDVQDRLRQLHATVASQSDPGQLLQVAAQYHEWLKSLTPGDRSELLELAPSERIQRVATLKREQDNDRFRAYVAREISDKDRNAIEKWFRELAARHEKEILEKWPEDERTRIEGMPPPWRQMMLLRELRPTKEEMNSLVERISVDVRRVLEANKEDPEKQWQEARTWMRAALISRRPPAVSQEELEKFYQELDEGDRNDLQKLPHDQFTKELRRRYFERNLGRGDSWTWRGPWRGGPPRRPRDGRSRGRFEGGRGRDRHPGPPGPFPEPPPEDSPRRPQ